MDKTVDLAIIGAGTAGLSAYKEAKKYTDNVVIIDKGPLGSTCARVGCMPSKVLLQAAHDFHNRCNFVKQGIYGADKLSIDRKAVFAYVRSLRDHFTRGVVEFTRSLGEQFICGEASFINTETLKVNHQTIHAKAIIIAAGSHSIIPAEWKHLENKLLTSETIFEQSDLCADVAVIGAGSIGLELGQALARTGINITAYHASSFIGGLSDPKVNETAVKLMQDDFLIHLNEKASLSSKNKKIYIQANHNAIVDQVVAAIGRQPDLKALGLLEVGIPVDERGLPGFDKTTLRIENTSIYLAGDANGYRPLLHEASDEGRMAAYNAVNKSQCFQRRIPLQILFTEPNIGVVGKGFRELEDDDIIIGEVDYARQGRAKIMHQNKGLLRIYGKKKNSEILGAEFIAPEGEHLAHLLAWAMAQKMTAFDVLKMPFYHPAVEEGMRTALRDLARQAQKPSSAFDLVMCDSEALHSLS